MDSLTVETDEEFIEPLRKGICLPIIARISEKLIGAYPMFKQKIIAAIRATIKASRIIFHLEERFEYLNSTVSVVIT
jgi:hypothetical protein